jgi:hypothetical protein
MRTGCFVKMCPKFLLTKFVNLLFKFLTLAAISLFLTANISHALENVFSQEKSQTYLRWNFFSNRDQIQFTKKAGKLIVKTLNSNLHETLKAELESTSFEDNYIKELKFNDADSSSNSFSFEIVFVDEHVESFSFYREREKKYVIDFWKDGETVTLSKKAVVEENVDKVELKMAQKEVVVPKKKSRKISNIDKDAFTKNEENTQDEKVLNKIKEDKVLSNIVFDPTKVKEKTALDIEKEDLDSKKPYRDFRYGATIMWDYDPIIPAYKSIVNLKNKTPEVFFPIANRDMKKSEKEAHLQLTINLYRQKKWGLMYKSMKLFEKKYGSHTEWELLEFLKANAIFRENIDTPNPEMFKNGISMITNLAEKSDNYEIKKAINKFLLTYYMERGEHLKTLQIAKNYYAGTRDNFDFEESAIPAEAMLNALAKLGQMDKIQELSEEKSFKKILPPQLLIAYQTFGKLRINDAQGLIAYFEKMKNSLAKPIDPVILYNVAEAYFRVGKFQESMNLFDQFRNEYSHEFVASNAHLRVAMCSDLLDKNYNDTIAQYKKAVDTSIDEKINYEARIRYVAFRTIRKKILDESDKEIRIFLDEAKVSNGEIDKNLKRLLQQVRLRTLIVDGKYKEALAYLNLIPMITMTQIEARVFDGDGAEIIYGIIADYFQKAEYTQVIKFWKNYKDKYVDKVAMDPYINFVVGNSYIKLGLYKGFDEVYAAFEKLKDTPNRTYPVWVERKSVLKASEMLAELNIVKDINLKNWDLASKNIENFSKSTPNYNRLNYYQGIISFGQKDYKSVVTHLENFFAKNSQRSINDPSDVAHVILAYTDSIYELGQTDKFLKVSEAILNDTSSFGANNAYILNVRERIAYLGIEIASGKNTGENFMVLEKKIVDFKVNNPKSIYLGRVNLLLGQNLINNKKIKEGKEILNTLMNDKDTSDYIKELAKSELSLVNLKEKTI